MVGFVCTSDADPKMKDRVVQLLHQKDSDLEVVRKILHGTSCVYVSLFLCWCLFIVDLCCARDCAEYAEQMEDVQQQSNNMLKQVCGVWRVMLCGLMLCVDLHLIVVLLSM